MKSLYIEHIGIAVTDLEKSIDQYEKIFGVKCYKTEEVPDQKVRTAFFMIDRTKIELLETTDAEGPVGKFIGKKGEGLHHIAVAVEDIEASLSSARDNGLRLIDQSPRKGADGLDIAFLHPASASGVLIELCQNKQQQVK
ncbi:MAG: methylmalonyl-CoA epimerase [Bacteroidales bacterium]|jgi:methylmalonyl-CoA/ethylmalonyl-CoA epimerase|nr:methylmalonyl-CoA epimerase [Bacteroidales bacterium]